MHIEPGVVTGAKIVLSYATAAGAGAIGLKMAWDAIKEKGLVSLAMRTVAAAVMVFSFFQLLPHYPVGVSEVHFILGSTLFLVFGAAPAALGLAIGLAIQSFFLAPFDIPQFGMNLTTLLVPLFGLKMIADRIIPASTRYVDLSYKQTLVLSAAFQAGVVAWVGFWAFYGQGFGAENLVNVSTFGIAYMAVILIEPLADLAILFLAKTMDKGLPVALVTPRLFNAA